MAISGEKIRFRRSRATGHSLRRVQLPNLHRHSAVHWSTRRNSPIQAMQLLLVWEEAVLVWRKRSTLHFLLFFQVRGSCLTAFLLFGAVWEIMETARTCGRSLLIATTWTSTPFGTIFRRSTVLMR